MFIWPLESDPMSQLPSRDHPARFDNDDFVLSDGAEDYCDEKALLSSSRESNPGPFQSTALPSRKTFWTVIVLILLLFVSCSLNIYLALQPQRRFTEEFHVTDEQCTQHLSPYCMQHLRLSFGGIVLTHNVSSDNRQQLDTVRLDSLQWQFPCELALARSTDLRTRDCLG